jgi:hypothetical protein
MRQLQTTEIKDKSGIEHTYSLIPYDAEYGVTLAIEIADILGDGLGKLFLGISGKSDDTDATPYTMLEFARDEITKVPAKLAAKGGASFLKKILNGVKREKTPKAADFIDVPKFFDDIYAANYKELLSAIWWVIDCNYGPFFD